MIPAASPAKRFLISTHWGGFFVTPDEARREQPIGGLCLRVRARVRSVWRFKVFGNLKKSAIFEMIAFFTALKHSRASGARN